MKKGFTLIELLAVIVILAIIALIATPIILGIIEDARKGSIEASANGYIDAVEYSSAKLELKGEKIADGTYDATKLEIDLDGEQPSSGVVTIKKGKVINATLTINNQTVYYNGNLTKVVDDKTTNYKENLLNGADPVLKDELIPVVILNDGTVIKANLKTNWYSYEDKRWANAVILFNKDDYKVGEIIPEENIKEYYVWIPKYSYRLWNVNGDNTDNVEKPIEIVFGSKAKTTGENNGDMYIHPAFENFGTQGLWVAKFELSYNEETFTDSSRFLKTNINYEVATDSSNIIAKPNVRSLTKKQVGDLYTIIYNSHRNLDSHMITNMEWGATAYLTNSIYGRCNSKYCSEVTINNVSTGWLGEKGIYDDQWEWGTAITGCAADSVSETANVNQDSCVNNYNSEKGYLASTTGNITGIYDMNGGSWEYVMGVLVNNEGKIFSGSANSWNSGFNGVFGNPSSDGSGILEKTDGINIQNKKYYTAYKNNYELTTNIWYDYSAGLLGDATIELVGNKNNGGIENFSLWFGDSAIFPTPMSAWMGRGGNWQNAKQGGIFYFANYHGMWNFSYSTRPVLAF